MADQVFSYPTESWHESDFSSGQQETNMDCKHKYLAVCRLKNIRTQATGFQLQLTHCMKILCANCIIFFFKNFPSLIYLFAAIALSSGTHTHTSSQVSDIQSSSLSSSPAPFHLKHYRPYPFAHINTFDCELVSRGSTNKNTSLEYRGSPDSTNFGLPGNRTIEKSY